jgi:hypothetical protein
MPIRNMFGNGSFSPEDVTAITTAFEDALRTLGLTDRTDAAVAMVAKRMIEMAAAGNCDAASLRDAVLKSFKHPGVQPETK